MTGKRGSLLERFQNKYIICPIKGCWLWIGSININGYSQIMLPHGKPDRAHRVSYRLFKGDIPAGLDVRHTCDVRHCVNPDHLLVGTRKQNMQDALDRGRTAREFKLPHCKLSKAEADKIMLDGRLQKDIAAEYGITQSHVCRIKNGERR